MDKVLLEHEGRALLQEAVLDVVPGEFFEDRDALALGAKTLRYPVVLKVVSADIVHKSDFGGVRVKIADEEALLAEYDDMMQSILARAPEALISGVLVTQFIEAQVEIIVGVVTDAQFGPVIMVGLGGIFVEIFKDLCFGIAPVDKDEARHMLESLKALPILQGSRARKPVNMDKLSEFIAKVSHFAITHGIEEMDLNPVFCVGDDVLIGDVRILLRA